jgi:hypothetical protein
MWVPALGTNRIPEKVQPCLSQALVLWVRFIPPSVGLGDGGVIQTVANRPANRALDCRIATGEEADHDRLVDPGNLRV